MEGSDRLSAMRNELSGRLGSQRYELLVLTLALERQERHLLVVVGRVDEVRRVARRAAGIGQRPLLDQHNVGPAQLGKVADKAAADDAGPNNYDVCSLRDLAHALIMSQPLSIV